MYQDSFDLFKKLHTLGYPKNLRDPYWWPNSGTFEVVIGAILTQNTKWESVEKSLNNLKQEEEITINSILSKDTVLIADMIKPSGFYNTKAKRIKKLTQNILDDFGCFDSFRDSVSREWLLGQEGIGYESADSILNYCCYKEEMVADKYSYNLLCAIGYELENYEDIKEWLASGIESNLDKVCEIYGKKEGGIARFFALFHGAIVEFCKSVKKDNYQEALS